MTFKIPLSAQAAANRIHKEGVPQGNDTAASFTSGDAKERIGELVTWRGVQAWYTDTEKADLRRLPADELWEIHRFKAELDATLIEETK